MHAYIHIYIYTPGTSLSSILVIEPSKTRSFPIKTRVIWVPGKYIYIVYFLGEEYLHTVHNVIGKNDVHWNYPTKIWRGSAKALEMGYLFPASLLSGGRGKARMSLSLLWWLHAVLHAMIHPT